MARVLITTFERGKNQGSQLMVGVKTIKVWQEDEQVTKRDGCCSAEIVTRLKVPTASINGRRFILEVPPLNDKTIEFQVIIPPDLAHRLIFCPHCGEII